MSSIKSINTANLYKKWNAITFQNIAFNCANIAGKEKKVHILTTLLQAPPEAVYSISLLSFLVLFLPCLSLFLLIPCCALQHFLSIQGLQRPAGSLLQQASKSNLSKHRQHFKLHHSCALYLVGIHTWVHTHGCVCTVGG